MVFGRVCISHASVHIQIHVEEVDGLQVSLYSDLEPTCLENLCKILTRSVGLEVKISYSCMTNIQQIIKSHNTEVLKKATQTPQEKTCNCRQPENCPLRGNCLADDVIYQATVISDENTVSYIGLASGEFKKRYNNHTKSFRHDRYRKDTELSKYIWGLKARNDDYSIRWDIIKQSNTHRRQSGLCNLCIEEKLAIISLKDNKLNKRTEIISKCRHGNVHKGKPPNRGKRK